MASSWRRGPWCLVFFFVFSKFFATLAQKCQNPWKNKKEQTVSPHVLNIFFVIFVFLMFGRKFHPDKHPLAKLSPLHMKYWCPHWVTDFGYWAIRENVEENISITHLFRLQALHCIDVFLVCWCFGSSSSEVWLVFFEPAISIYNTNLCFFRNKMFEKRFVVQKIYLSQSVRSFKKAILYPSQQNSSKEGCCFLWKEADTIL